MFQFLISPYINFYTHSSVEDYMKTEKSELCCMVVTSVTRRYIWNFFCWCQQRHQPKGWVPISNVVYQTQFKQL